jgi:hypothetical protein
MHICNPREEEAGDQEFKTNLCYVMTSCSPPHNKKRKRKKQKQGWGCGSSGRAPAEQSPEFKAQYDI